uniref:LppU/SCO3897 family protein n=1 Tax=Plantactinospora solaniradicis TaxID=1723736 RepID=UPI0036711E7D
MQDQPQSGAPAAPYGSPYGPPGAQYGAPGAQYGAPGAQYSPPGAPYGPPGAPLGQPGAPKKKGGLKLALIIGGVVLLLLCACVGGGVWWLVDRAPDDSGTNPIGAPTSTAGPATPTPRTTPSSSTERYAKGDCLVNDGTDSDPKLRKVTCGPDTFEVLSRIPFTTDPDQCKEDAIFGAPEADAHYVQDDPLDLGDFVLCLKSR